MKSVSDLYSIEFLFHQRQTEIFVQKSLDIETIIASRYKLACFRETFAEDEIVPELLAEFSQNKRLTILPDHISSNFPQIVRGLKLSPVVLKPKCTQYWNPNCKRCRMKYREQRYNGYFRYPEVQWFTMETRHLMLGVAQFCYFPELPSYTNHNSSIKNIMVQLKP